MTDTASPQNPQRTPNLGKAFTNVIESIGIQRYAGHTILLMLVGGMIWFARTNLLGAVPTQLDMGPLAAMEIAAVPTATPEGAAETVSPPDEFNLTPAADPDSSGLTRQTDIHTNIPTRPRTDIQTYTVESGDTLFGIAEKYGLEPETILWGNPILQDNPHSLRPGQELRISPTNGVLHDVVESNSIKGLALAFGVTEDDIIYYPGNNIDSENPKLTVGQVLIVPGGHREFVQWVVPQILRTVKRALPLDAGPGACAGGYSGGAIGSGGFIWPANSHYLSGNNYWAGHLGIDIAAGIGDPIYASDSGVTVFAGWSNWGYGNMVVIDHGNGWQTLYAHLRDTGVLSKCGESVVQGQVIGWAGSTGNSSGPHLHFEMNYQGSRPNPYNYLP